MLESARTIIDLDNAKSWPNELLAYLDVHHQIFLNWETRITRVDPAAYDESIAGLVDVMQAYAVVGWHCSRLTDREVAAINATGMQLPNAAMLNHRIDAVAQEGLISSGIVERLRAKNQAHEANRAGMIWFCFFPPRIAGESGVGDLLRFWGGEALYNSHDRHPETSAALRAVGTPAIVEATVPVALLGAHVGLAFKLVRTYLIDRGYNAKGSRDCEGNIKLPLPPDCIRRVICFPHPDFLNLSGCKQWYEPLNIGRRHG